MKIKNIEYGERFTTVAYELENDIVGNIVLYTTEIQDKDLKEIKHLVLSRLQHAAYMDKDYQRTDIEKSLDRVEESLKRQKENLKEIDKLNEKLDKTFIANNGDCNASKTK